MNSDETILNNRLKQLIIKCPDLLFQYVKKLKFIENALAQQNYKFVIQPTSIHSYDAKNGKVDCNYLAKFIVEEYRFFDMPDITIKRSYRSYSHYKTDT